MSNGDFVGIGGAPSKRNLKIYWLVDVSGSMADGGKITELNRAIRVCIPELVTAAEDNVEIATFVRAMKFSNEATWHTGETKIADFKWNDLSAYGLTSTGAALRLLAEELDIEKMGKRNLPPVCILISDGDATDDYDAGISELLSIPWGKKSVRIAIAIGSEANIEQLAKFCSHKEIPPLLAQNAADLVNYIKWVSTSVTRGMTNSQIGGGSSDTNVQLPPPPAPTVVTNVDDSDPDVW